MSASEDVTDLCRECSLKTASATLAGVRSFVAGLDGKVPLLDGRNVTYVNLDNAATTPPFTTVLECLEQFFHWYSSVHRGAGFKSRLSTHVYERCREAVAEFIGADLAYHTLIFVQNATHALNKLANRICPADGHVILSTMMEHHSNLLPWRKLGCTVDYVSVRREDGQLDMAELERKVKRHAGRLCLVTVSGASNVTGNMPPLGQIARLIHSHGAMVAVDATQLVPHRPFNMGAPDDPERVDFAAFSAHKMYAPFGSGVLVGPRWVFERGTPDMVGGGTISAVTMDEVIWAQPPERDEAGTPNVPGVLALAVATQTLKAIGMENLAEHERALTRRALERLTRMDRVQLYGMTDPEVRRDRLGVISFNVEGISHPKLAAILGYEWGIGVRNGCFCAQPYVRELLGVPAAEMKEILTRLAAGNHVAVPGMVRASLGVYNTADEVDYLLESLQKIITDGPNGRYVVDQKYLDYVPDPPVCQLDQYVLF